MTPPTELHPLADTYVKELRDAARRMPRAQRNELIAEIRAHLAETAPASASQAEALNALERLGEPAAILQEQGTDAAAPSRRMGLQEVAAILLLMFGGFLFVVGWLGGLVLLWSSDRWTLPDKVVGTLIVPGGFATGAWLTVAVMGSTRECSGGTGNLSCVAGGPTTLQLIAQAVLVIALLLGPLASAFYLARRAR